MACTYHLTNALPDGKWTTLSLEAKRGLQASQHVYLEAVCGCFLQVKVNGKPKTWKRQPGRVQVPWKYGLWQHGYIDQHTEVRVPSQVPAQMNLV